MSLIEKVCNACGACTSVRERRVGWVGVYLGEVMLSGESQAIHSIGSTVRPLAKLL